MASTSRSESRPSRWIIITMLSLLIIRSASFYALLPGGIVRYGDVPRGYFDLDLVYSGVDLRGR